MHLYRVKMSHRNSMFMVAAKDESTAARTAESQWAEWGYAGDGKVISVELVGFGGQYPPRESEIPWFLISRSS